MLVAVTEGKDCSTRMKDSGLQNNGISIDWAKMMASKRTFTDPGPEHMERGLEKAGVVTLHGTSCLKQHGAAHALPFLPALKAASPPKHAKYRKAST